jgi:hypothetical protein
VWTTQDESKDASSANWWTDTEWKEATEDKTPQKASWGRACLWLVIERCPFRIPAGSTSVVDDCRVCLHSFRTQIPAATSIRPRPLPSKYFQMYHSLIILPLDAIQSGYRKRWKANHIEQRIRAVLSSDPWVQIRTPEPQSFEHKRSPTHLEVSYDWLLVKLFNSAQSANEIKLQQTRYRIRSIGLWRWNINITVTILNIIHRPVFYLKLNSTL